MKAPLVLAAVLLLSSSHWGFSAEPLPPEPLPEFSSIDNNLEKSESLITDTLNSSEELTQQLATDGRIDNGIEVKEAQ